MILKSLMWRKRVTIAQVAIKKIPQTDGLTNRNLFSHSSGG